MSLYLLIVCAVLLRVGCDASHFSNRRNLNDAQISLGQVKGNDIMTLPILHVHSGTTIGFPNNCNSEGKLLVGTQVVASSKYSAIPPNLSAENADNPMSYVKIQCQFSGIIGSGCPGGVDVTTYQFCGPYPDPYVADTAPEE